MLAILLFFFIFVNIHVSSYYMYILYHAKQQMVSQILYLFFKYNSLKIFIVMNEEKKVNKIFQIYVSLGWLNWVLHSILSLIADLKYPSYLPASFSWKHFNKLILLFSSYVKVLTDRIRLASRIWMFINKTLT